MTTRRALRAAAALPVLHPYDCRRVAARGTVCRAEPPTSTLPMRPLSNSPAIERLDRSAHLVLSGPVRAPVRAAGEASDVELSIRVHRDGTRITVARHSVADADGRRTVGIEAVIR
jgi:hypothetical protein